MGDLLAEPGGIPAEADQLAPDGGGVVVHDFLLEIIDSHKAKKGNLPPLFWVTLSEKLIYISHMNRHVNVFRNYFAKIANFKYF